jgi:hypothetical protein
LLVLPDALRHGFAYWSEIPEAIRGRHLSLFGAAGKAPGYRPALNDA